MKTQENGNGMAEIHANGTAREDSQFVDLTPWLQRINGADHEDSRVIDLTPWLDPETGSVPMTPERLAQFINRLVCENAQVVEVAEVMNTAIAHGEQLEDALAGLLGPDVLGSHSDTELAELFGHRGMAVIIAARVLAARCAEARQAAQQRVTNGGGGERTLHQAVPKGF